MLKLLLLLILCFLFSFADAAEELCRNIIIHDVDLNLNETETRMACGDEELKAYKNIPPYEAEIFLKGFLQARGYLNPRFEIKDDVLHVYPEEKSEVHKIYVESSHRKLGKEIQFELRKLFVDKNLNTSILNAVEKYSLRLLRERGYPCAKVTSEAYTSNNQIKIFLEEGNKYEFGKVEKEEIKGLRPNALNRYYPYKENEVFDIRLLELTEKRLVRSEVVQGTYFLEHCGEEEFSLKQEFIPGPPRTLKFGVGASTELGPMARVRWSHNRYKSMASLLMASFQTSFRTQSLNLSADSFFWHGEPRRSLLTQFEVMRENQVEYDQVMARLTSHLKWTRDSESFHKIYTLGPSLESGYFSSNRKATTRSYSTGVLEGALTWTSHAYEFFDIHPEDGTVLKLNASYYHPALGFSDELFKVGTSLLELFPITSSGRGNLIGGVKVDAGTSFTHNQVSLESLPPTVKFFGGGSDDIRGFQLLSLPHNQGGGALTRLGLKLEVRRTHLYFSSVEGVVFNDFAYFGEKSWDIDPPLYYSPGVGLRWLSPIGLVQGYVSRGFRTRPFDDLGYYFYAGIGGTF